MALDPYAPCPCGSGKKFKWCCQPIHEQINQAFSQDAQGQHETALKLMDQVVHEHAGNPEAWGRQAQLLYNNGRPDDAEAALQKAFAINPDYPFGLLLRGMMRAHEGELPGALLLFRKAAAAYDPEARDLLGQLYSMIADAEMKLNKPVAARAALRIAAHCLPADQQLRQGLEQAFGPESRLPETVRRDYTLLPAGPSVGGAGRAQWDAALAAVGSANLSRLAQAFETVTAASAGDAAAWYNLGLVRAWLGENRGAVEALDRYIELEGDEARAAGAMALTEVLRLAHGLEEQTDYVEYSSVMQLRDPQAFVRVLQDWDGRGRLIGTQARQEEQFLMTVVLEPSTGVLATRSAATEARLGAYLVVSGDLVRLWGPSKERQERALMDLRQAVGPGLSPPQSDVGPASFGDVLAGALIFPVGLTDPALIEQRAKDYATNYYEETWPHQPLKALGRTAPAEAAGDPVRRKRLRGVIQFLQECAAQTSLQGYDFDRLRRKLGLLGGAAPSADGAADLRSLGAEELAGVDVAGLNDEQLDQGYQAAQKLGAQDLAGRFAEALVARPPSAAKPDRYVWYNFLVQRALAEGNTDRALQLLEGAEQADREHNAGQRANDYAQRRGQVHVKRGDAAQAEAVFNQLIEQAPTAVRYRGVAAEAMLSLKQPAKALQFAEKGLAEARKQNDRDSEQYLMELVGAARKQGA